MPQLIHSGFQRVSKNIKIWVSSMWFRSNITCSQTMCTSPMIYGRACFWLAGLNILHAWTHRSHHPPNLSPVFFNFSLLIQFCFLSRGWGLDFEHVLFSILVLQTNFRIVAIFFASFKHFLAADLDSGANPPNPRLSLWSWPETYRQDLKHCLAPKF